MNAGINLYSLRTLIDTEERFLNTAIKLKEQGYSYLQYSGAPFDPQRIKRVCDGSGLPVVLTHVPLDRIINDTDALMDDHDVFGCRYIGLAAMPFDIATDFDKVKRTVEGLEAAAEKMERNGFKFFYHNHHTEFIRYGGETIFDRLVNNAPHVNFTADVYWLQYGGADVTETIKRLSGRVGCIHLKDYRIVPKRTEKGLDLVPDFAPVGAGSFDFPRIVKTAREAGAELFFVEQDDACLYDDPFAQVGQSIDYVLSHL